MTGGVSSPPSIEARGLSRVYNPQSPSEHLALADVSFSISAGLVYGLLGPNGAGKTTLLRILATIISPSGGSASINGLDLSSEKLEVRRHIGFISSSTGLYDRLTARETLVYLESSTTWMRPRLQKRVCELSTLLDMDSFLDRKNEVLSHGQRQRVSIARSMIHSPSVFILDEPTTGLDVVAARTVVEFIKYLRSGGRLVLLATHDMLLAKKLCDSVIFLHRGRVFGRGSLEEFEKRYGTNDLEEVFLSLMKAAGENA